MMSLNIRKKYLFLIIIEIFLTVQRVSSATLIPPTSPTRPEVKAHCRKSSTGQQMLYHKATQKCYAMGTRGPCQSNLYYFPIPYGTTYGDCDCPQPGDLNGDSNPFPNIYHKASDKCYTVYSQAFCDNDRWLTFKDNFTVQCVDNPCIGKTSILNVVDLDGNCVGLGSICGSGEYSVDKYVHLHNGATSPTCDESYADTVKSNKGSLKCGKGLKLDSRGNCQEIVELAST